MLQIILNVILTCRAFGVIAKETLTRSVGIQWMCQYFQVWVTLTSAKLPAWTGLRTHSAEYITWLLLQITKKKQKQKHVWWSFRQNYILPAFLILLSLISHRLVQWIVSMLLYAMFSAKITFSLEHEIQQQFLGGILYAAIFVHLNAKEILAFVFKSWWSYQIFFLLPACLYHQSVRLPETTVWTQFPSTSLPKIICRWCHFSVAQRLIWWQRRMKGRLKQIATTWTTTRALLLWSGSTSCKPTAPSTKKKALPHLIPS